MAKLDERIRYRIIWQDQLNSRQCSAYSIERYDALRLAQILNSVNAEHQAVVIPLIGGIQNGEVRD